MEVNEGNSSDKVYHEEQVSESAFLPNSSTNVKAL
jgi:hypothetical protein